MELKTSQKQVMDDLSAYLNHLNQRKPIMDAMKAAIRQEDMAKGIYAHVADLPRQEPKRAEIQVRTAG